MAQQIHQRVAVYFVASPLNYLAARRVALDHEAGSRQVLVCYRPALKPMVREADWDAVVHMPWPRFDPLPGRFGRARRMLDNLEQVSQGVGPCHELHLHSPVFDTEAINYFLRALPEATGAASMRARILPDGMQSMQREPLRLGRRLAQRLRRLRRFYDRRLDYWCYSGDRTGADAPFVDRVYVLNGFPHDYDPARVVVLAPLVSRPSGAGAGAPASRRALVVGQPLASSGAISEADRQAVARAIESWLSSLDISDVAYKAHPREARPREFMQPHYRELELDCPLETHLAEQPYAAIAGCASTALVTARQIQSPDCRIAAFGVEKVRLKGENATANMLALLRATGVDLHPLDGNEEGRSS